MTSKQKEQPLILERTSKGVHWITLNRPKQRNPLSSSMLIALTDALVAASENMQVRVIVVAGSGPVFSAGHDLREMARQNNESTESQRARIRAVLDLCSNMMLKIVHSPKAVIACVHGTATAAGCQLVSACDLAVAADNATFCTPGVNIGGFCTTPLVGVGRNVHRKHAMAMALTGEAIDANEAARTGLINEVVPAEALTARVRELSELIASKSAQGIREGKADFYRQVEMPLEDAFSFANDAMVRAMTTQDSIEGSAAFFAKRAPKWTDLV